MPQASAPALRVPRGSPYLHRLLAQEGGLQVLLQAPLLFCPRPAEAVPGGIELTGVERMECRDGGAAGAQSCPEQTSHLPMGRVHATCMGHPCKHTVGSCVWLCQLRADIAKCPGGGVELLLSPAWERIQNSIFFSSTAPGGQCCLPFTLSQNSLLPSPPKKEAVSI